METNTGYAVHEPKKLGYLYCSYDCKEESCDKKQVDMVKDHTHLYSIDTLFETVMPVKCSSSSLDGPFSPTYWNNDLNMDSTLNTVNCYIWDPFNGTATSAK